MRNAIELLEEIACERPAGTEANENVLRLIEEEARAAGCAVEALPFDCRKWIHGPSCLETGAGRFDILPGPYSGPACGCGPLIPVSSLGELESMELAGAIVVLHGGIAKEQLMAKGHPFYFPDEHRRVIEALEAKRPLAVLAATGRHPMTGQEPFPVFEDGNFTVPSAYIHERMADDIPFRGEAHIRIDSGTMPARSRQLVAVRKGKGMGRIALCAHMDTKYGTPGAVDNAAGVTALLLAMRLLADHEGGCDVEFVPFNSEESYEPKGETAYLNRIGGPTGVRLCVNVDGACLKGARVAVSGYNLDAGAETVLDAAIAAEELEHGQPWYAGDHAAFAFSGVPSVAVTSGSGASPSEFIHTARDTLELVDANSIERTAAFLARVVRGIG